MKFVEASEGDVVSAITVLFFAAWRKVEAIKTAKSKTVIIRIFVVFGLVISLHYVSTCMLCHI